MVTMAKKPTFFSSSEELVVETVSNEPLPPPSYLAQSLTRLLVEVERLEEEITYTDPQARRDFGF